MPAGRTRGREAHSALVLLGAAWLLVATAQRPPAPVGEEAPATEFSAARARARLERILADGTPHPVGSPAAARVRTRIERELRGLGLEPEVRRTFTCGRYANCATVENVRARVEGRDPHAAPLVLAAHYDSRAASPGASDDGVGVAALLEVAAALLAGPPPPRPVILLIDDGEEDGLHGAEAFASEDPWARRVHAVLNLEARGTSGPAMLFETSSPNLSLIRAYARSVRRPATSSLLFTLYRLLPNDTDLSVFRFARSLHHQPGRVPVADEEVEDVAARPALEAFVDELDPLRGDQRHRVRPKPAGVVKRPDDHQTMTARGVQGAWPSKQPSTKPSEPRDDQHGRQQAAHGEPRKRTFNGALYAAKGSHARSSLKHHRQTPAGAASAQAA